MAPIFLIIAIVIGTAALELTTETAGEYFATYMIEPSDLGASTRTPKSVGAAPERSYGVVESDTADVLFAAVDAGQIDGRIDGHMNGHVNGAAVGPATGTGAVAEPPTPAEIPPAAATQRAVSDPPSGASLGGGGGGATATGVDGASSALLALIGDRPHRQLDGSVFMPITTQRVFGLRTVLGERADAPPTTDLPGRIVVSPSSSTLVQVSNEGFIEAHNGSYPFVGQSVKRGQLLAYLQPVNDHLEQTRVQERIEELINEIDLDRKRMARLEEVIYVRYRGSKIEALRVEIRGLQRQVKILQNALNMRYELRTKTDGILSRVEAQIGEYVDQGETIFEIVDPSRLWVEANAFDSNVARDIESASAFTADGRPIKLRFVGGGLQLSQQAVHLQFEIVGASADLAVDTPVTVVIRGRTAMIGGVKVPRRSVVRTSDGRQMVWERRSAERFVANHVSTRSLDADNVLVVSGLSAGVRIVTDGAAALDQVR